MPLLRVTKKANARCTTWKELHPSAATSFRPLTQEVDLVAPDRQHCGDHEERVMDCNGSDGTGTHQVVKHHDIRAIVLGTYSRPSREPSNCRPCRIGGCIREADKYTNKKKEEMRRLFLVISDNQSARDVELVEEPTRKH